jgi:hypothetical protein
VQTPPPAAQNPSPMTESTRAHERLVQKDFDGVKRSFNGPGAKPVEVFIPRRVNGDKPVDIVDQCSNGVGITLHDGICGSAVVPVYGTPRTVAGEPISTDQNKCQLKPLRRSDYRVTFTAAQWASLEKTFPAGVCDYSKPGVDQQPTAPWLTYQNAHGGVVYGGSPIGPVPVSTPLAPSAFVSAGASHASPSAATAENGRLAVTGGPTQALGLVGLLLVGAAAGLRSCSGDLHVSDHGVHEPRRARAHPGITSARLTRVFAPEPRHVGTEISKPSDSHS